MSSLPNDGIPIGIGDLDDGLLVESISVATGILLIGDEPSDRPTFVVELGGILIEDMVAGNTTPASGRFILQRDGAESLRDQLTRSIDAWPT